MATPTAFGHGLSTFREKGRRNRRPAPQKRAPPTFHLPRRAVFERRRGRAAEPAAPHLPDSLRPSSRRRHRLRRSRHRHHRRFSSGDEELFLGPSPLVCPVAVSFDAKTIRKTSPVTPGLCRFEVWEEAWEI